MDYYEQLTTDEWKKKRVEIFMRDDCKCYMCGHNNIKQLQVHHRLYKKGLMAWEYDNDDLITLCNSCHRKVHNHLIKSRQLDQTKISNIYKKIIKNG